VIVKFTNVTFVETSGGKCGLAILDVRNILKNLL